MGDLRNINRSIQIKKYEHAKLIAQAQIQAREIRILELHEEIARCENDILQQKKVIEDNDKMIKQQMAEIDKEKTA